MGMKLLNKPEEFTGGIMKRGGYSMDLVKQVKVRIDEHTFKNLIKISKKKGRTISSLLRDIIESSLDKSV
jgi:hypothetical protein